MAKSYLDGFSSTAIVLVSCKNDKPKANNAYVLTFTIINSQVSLSDEFGKTTISERMFIKSEGNGNYYIGEIQKSGVF